MYDPSSRYYALETATLTDPLGRQIPYTRRRLLPQGSSMATIGYLTILAGERVDLVAARALGDPLQYWQLCDANNAMNPFDLATRGRVLRVGMPSGTG
jgi:hypothetical protein